LFFLVIDEVQIILVKEKPRDIDLPQPKAHKKKKHLLRIAILINNMHDDKHVSHIDELMFILNSLFSLTNLRSLFSSII